MINSDRYSKEAQTIIKNFIRTHTMSFVDQVPRLKYKQYELTYPQGIYDDCTSFDEIVDNFFQQIIELEMIECA